MSCDFTVTTHGKWILAGEHAVIRGGKALVFPLKSKQLTLSFTPNSQKLSANFFGDSANDIHLLFFSVIEHGFKLSGHTINHTQGHFDLTNHVPLGAGMGASAALCVAVAKWFISEGKVKPSELLNFAKSLEDLFHSKSSGLDIIGSSSEDGILYENGDIRTIKPTWQPTWFLSFSGHLGVTSHCVKKVDTLWKDSPSKGLEIDKKMSESVTIAYDALVSAKEDRIQLLSKAIKLAGDCFSDWGLTDSMLKKHLNTLYDHGALAAKPTGSGSGGYVLSLWDSPPPAILKPLLLPI